MNIEQSVEILRQLVSTALLIVSPILLTAMVVGLAVSLFQSVTSIQEATLTFVPKLVAIALLLVAAAPWMLRMIMQFTITFFNKIPEMVN